MISVSTKINLPESELDFQFVRSQGPGGQNVNKVSTAVELRFDVGASLSLPAAVKGRLRSLAANRISKEDVLIIKAQGFRTQDKNRQDAIARLVQLIREAEHVPKVRRKTKISRGVLKRIKKKKQARSDKKKNRGQIRDW